MSGLNNRVRILGAGLYGLHLACALQAWGVSVEVHEIADDIFAGATGNSVGRLHAGFHYPRSKLTRAACQMHNAQFMATYGDLTAGVRNNIYAIAKDDSLIDFGAYRSAMQSDGSECINIVRPKEFGLDNVEGALLTGERHLVISKAKEFFKKKLGPAVRLNMPKAHAEDSSFDWNIDCTFCSTDAVNVDRFEPCLTVLLESCDGIAERAVTIMDGPFPSIYPWNEDRALSTLTSAKYTPLSKECRTYEEAQAVLKNACHQDLVDRGNAMMDQMAHYWPGCTAFYNPVDYMTAIRAMPKSAADSRLVDVVKISDRVLRIRAGKIDAIFAAEDIVKDHIRAAA